MVSHRRTQAGKWARRIGGGALVLALVGMLGPATTRAMVDEEMIGHEVIEIEGEAPFEPPNWDGHTGSGGSIPDVGGGGGGPGTDPDQEPAEQGEAPEEFQPTVGGKCHATILDTGVLHSVDYGRYKKSSGKASKVQWECCRRAKRLKEPSCVECAKQGTGRFDQPCRNGWFVKPKP